MAYDPQIPQFLASNPDSTAVPRRGDPQLHLFMFPQAPAQGHVVVLRIPDKASPGLTWIGDIVFGSFRIGCLPPATASKHATPDRTNISP